MLPDEHFILIHRFSIINIDHVKEAEGNMVSIDQHRLAVSKRMREQFILN